MRNHLEQTVWENCKHVRFQYFSIFSSKEQLFQDDSNINGQKKTEKNLSVYKIFLWFFNSFSAIESDSLANLVSQRIDLEIMMREILEIERRLSQLTPESPDYTDGKLTPVTINELQVLFRVWDGIFLNEKEKADWKTTRWQENSRI